MQVIYRQQPKVSGLNHFGSRLVFAHDGSLFVTQGDRTAYREQAQDLSSGHWQNRAYQSGRIGAQRQSICQW